MYVFINEINWLQTSPLPLFFFLLSKPDQMFWCSNCSEIISTHSSLQWIKLVMAASCNICDTWTEFKNRDVQSQDIAREGSQGFGNPPFGLWLRHKKLLRARVLGQRCTSTDTGKKKSKNCVDTLQDSLSKPHNRSLLWSTPFKKHALSTSNKVYNFFLSICWSVASFCHYPSIAGALEALSN